MTLEKQYTEHKQLIVGENDLLTWCKNHEKVGQIIIKEWDAERNGSITRYKAGSDISVYWRCSICNQLYVKSIKERIQGKIHEPCGRELGKQRLKEYHKNKIPFNKSLAFLYPELLSEWDYENNRKIGCEPEYISAYSSKKVYWICKTCGNKFSVEVRGRTTYGRGCKICKHK